jgi:iron complex outermembrane receptor protein
VKEKNVRAYPIFRVLLLGAAAFSAACVARAQAAPQSSPDVPASTGTQTLEEVVVTARRRQESLQDVAISITALTGKTLEEAGVTRVTDIAELVPNMTYENAFQLGENHLTIRGITQHDEGPPPAAIVEDGVLLIAPNMQFNQQEFDLERVEVLRGPQGAIYGRNAISGAMLILTQEPTNEFQGHGLVGGGNGDDYKAMAAIGGPIVADTLLARASMSYENRDGQLLNVTTGRYVDHYRDATGRLRVFYNLAQGWQLDLKARYSDSAGPDPTYVLIPVDGQPNWNNLPIVSNTIGNNPRHVFDASAKLNWTTELGTLSFIGAYVHGRESIFLDYDFTALNMFTAAEEFREGGVSEELRFTSRSDSPFRWILGAYHVSSYREKDTQAYADPGYFLTPPAPTGVVNFQIISDVNRNDFKNTSGFGQLEYDLTKSLELGLALRYDDDRLMQPGTGEATFTKWQPKATLRYKFTDEMNVYGSYGVGFRSGFFNPPLRSFGDAVVRPEVADTYELGFKGMFLNRRLLTNVAAFYTKLTDSQEQVFDGKTGNDVGSNIDESRIIGGEIETEAILFDGFSINVSGGVADSKIQKFAVDPSVEGNKLPLVPNYTLNTGITYERSLVAQLNGFLRVDYNRIGPTPWYRDNQDIRHPVNYLNGRLGVRTKDSRWTVTAWVKNWLNDITTYRFQSIEATQHPSGDDIYYPAVGRTWGLELEARF